MRPVSLYVGTSDAGHYDASTLTWTHQGSIYRGNFTHIPSFIQCESVNKLIN